MRTLIIIICFFIILSCDSKKIERYENGNIKKEYSLQKDKIEGFYKEYYENGNIKEIHKYRDGARVDSSFYYYKTADRRIKRIKYNYIEDTLQIKDYAVNGVLIREGSMLQNENKIGKWFLYREDGTLSEVLEYIDLDGKEYLNQGWHFDKKEDTIPNKGNYLKFKFSKDTVHLYEPIKVLVKLQQPLLSYNSEVYICIPKGSFDEVNDNFSNLREIEWDTLPSIKNEKIIENYNKYNLYVSFGLEFNKPGIKHIRGFLSENNEISLNKQKKDSINMKERKIYFDEIIYVKDKK